MRLFAERQKHPPGTGTRDPAAGIVDHDGIVIADAERADVAAELLGGGKHVRQRIGMIRHRVDVEEHRARDVRGEIVVLRQRQHARHLEAGVDDPDAGLVEVCGQPFGRDERVGIRGHGLFSCVIIRLSWPGKSAKRVFAPDSPGDDGQPRPSLNNKENKMSETSPFLGIVSGDRRRTHAEVADRADRIASGLARIGVKQGDCVCMLMRNDIAFLESAYAAMRLGAYG
ncbi:hypothetical protein KXW38_009839, partial [Aspergillus fumigatus]